MKSIPWVRCASGNVWQPHGTFTLVSNLVISWYHLHIWPPNDTTYTSCKVGHQMAPLALVTKLTTRWDHLHWFQRPLDSANCISCKFTHQMAAQTTRFVLTVLYNCGEGQATCIGFNIGHQTTCRSFKLVHMVLSLALPHIVLDCPVGIISWYWVGIFINQSHIS